MVQDHDVLRDGFLVLFFGLPSTFLASDLAARIAASGSLTSKCTVVLLVVVMRTLYNESRLTLSLTTLLAFQ